MIRKWNAKFKYADVRDLNELLKSRFSTEVFFALKLFLIHNKLITNIIKKRKGLFLLSSKTILKTILKSKHLNSIKMF